MWQEKKKFSSIATAICHCWRESEWFLSFRSYFSPRVTIEWVFFLLFFSIKCTAKNNDWREKRIYFHFNEFKYFFFHLVNCELKCVTPSFTVDSLISSSGCLSIPITNDEQKCEANKQKNQREKNEKQTISPNIHTSISTNLFHFLLLLGFEFIISSHNRNAFIRTLVQWLHCVIKW